MLKKDVDGLWLKFHFEMLNFEGFHGAEMGVEDGGFNFAACIWGSQGCWGLGFLVSNAGEIGWLRFN